MKLPDAVVVVGASGFLGRNIVEALRGRILLLGVNTAGRSVPGCDRTVAFEEIDELPALPARSVIVHVAAFRYFARHFAQQQADILSANVALTNGIYRFALARGITELRIAGSSAVYPASWPILDDAKPIDLNDWPHCSEAAYAWSKRWGEIAAELWRRRCGINTLTFRLTNPYGAFDTLEEDQAHVATAFVIRALRHPSRFVVRGDPDAERDFVFAGDVASTFVASLGIEGRTEAVNCAAGDTTRIADLARTAICAAGGDCPLEIPPSPSDGYGGVKIRRATATRLRAMLPDLPPYCPLDAGMAATVAWYRDALH